MLKLPSLYLFYFVFISYSASAWSMRDSIPSSPWAINAYAEIFTTFKSNQTAGQRLSDFQYNHNRIKKLALNQACLDASYITSTFRMNVALQAGTYVVDNYAAEPAPLRALYRASAAIRLSKKKEAWLEAGTFPSYVGFESVSSFENATLTRSLFAENSPYFLTGLQANYPINEKNDLSFHLHTGWQRIVPQKENSLPSFGWQWVHLFRNENKFNWSVWIGSDYPDTTRRMRYFNNLYFRGKQDKFAYTLGFDIGAEQKAKGSSDFFIWYSPVAIFQYSFSPHWRAAIRVERYADPNRVVVKPSNAYAALVNSQSLNIDFVPIPNLLCRLEWRSFQGNSPIFLATNRYLSRTNYLTLSVAYQLRDILSL